MRDILQLRSRERMLTEAPFDKSRRNPIQKFLEDAKAVDTTFVHRMTSTEAGFIHDLSYRVVIPPIIPPNATGPRSFFIYDDASAAVLSNRLRSLRLMVLGSLVRTATFLETHDPSHEPTPERLWAESRVQKLVDDTCSSHAFAFGYADGIDSIDGRPSEIIGGAAGPGFITPDRNSLAWDVIWTLQMGAAFECVPAPQREWMEQQIGEYKRRYDIRG